MTESIILGGGCFWCVEAVFKRVEGVVSVRSGYAGGDTVNPSYEQVCTGRTGHAEVVEVVFDPQKIPLEKILHMFFKSHDATQVNRQGHDVGTQYRSAIYLTDDSQRSVAEKVRDEVRAGLRKPIATEIQPLNTFYEAESYHQDYFDKNPNAGYCRAVIQPKIGKLDIPKIPIIDT
jgi:peptide-methionine (S)-S-oxide reductase